MQFYNWSGKHISGTEIATARRNGTITALENKHNVRYVVVDSKFVYLVDREIYDAEFRRQRAADQYPRVITRARVAIHENTCRDGTFYTLGNIFSNDSIIMDERFRDFFMSEGFRNILYKELRTVEFELMGDQYVLKDYML